MRTPKINLRKLNRILRWTGWRLTFEYDPGHKKDTMVYFNWHGWGFVKNLKKDLDIKA
jgi:hypothetical protein